MTGCIALTGAPQSGKSEIGPKLDALPNCRFVNLNEVGYSLRRVDAPTRVFYDEIVPGCLHDNGKHRPEYYQRMLQTRGLIEKVLGFELPLIAERAEELIRSKVKDDTNLVLSWEYWPMVLNKVTPDRVLFMDCKDREVWFNRLQKRAADRGYDGPPLSNEVLSAMISAVKCSPDELLIKCRESDSDVIVIDSSGGDWGFENVMRVIES